MKKLSISIPKSCAENRNNFAFTSDFTKMSDSEIVSILRYQASMNFDGRFETNQTKTFRDKTSWVNPGLKFLRAALASLLCLLMMNQTFAQTIDTKIKTETVQGEKAKEKNISAEYVIKGTVRSEDDNQLLPGANVYLKGTNEGTYVDAEGKFEFPRKLKEGDVLLFSFVGFETQEYIVTANTQQPLEITMIVSPEIMMGEASTDVYQPKQSGAHRMWRKLKQTVASGQ